ncbi:MAG TPA: isocitrate lyase/phosphoenolpyruvate mutase family protein [Solirubrobacteraceae bacterium]|nr:isocitrate lyase/phosphoenolpyruvate mutase family protein [Solirubrobacteraceae bacterium]
MSEQAERARRFLALHRPGDPVLLPNAWDVGSAKLFQSLGAQALATTSSGHAAALGRLDGGVSRDEAIEHAAALTEATGLPVTGDFEDCFAREPEGVAETVRHAIEAGLAGCSVEDFTRDAADPIYELGPATERVAAAVEAIRSSGAPFVLTARCDNHLRGRDDLDDTIARLRAYREAGAHALYAPGLRRIEDVRRLIDAVDGPVNVLAGRGVPPVAELAEAGAARVSVGGSFAFVAYGAAVRAARELLESGTYEGWAEQKRTGVDAARDAFGP